MLILDVLISNGGFWANDDHPLGLNEPEIFIIANLDTREYEKSSFH
jgi:hypothetical protein